MSHFDFRSPIILSLVSLGLSTSLPGCSGKEKSKQQASQVKEGQKDEVISADLKEKESPEASEKKDESKPDSKVGDFAWVADSFADSQVLRYQVPGFESLSLKQKQLLYYLYEAALSGRDIIYDQKYKHNLAIRRTVESLLQNYSGDKQDADFLKLKDYAKQIWFARGVHHDYSGIKVVPEFSKEWFKKQLLALNPESLPLSEGEDAAGLYSKLEGPIFDPNVDSKRVNRDPKADPVVDSANNFYEGVTAKEVEVFYSKVINKKDKRPISYGLNSKIVKEKGKVVEKAWKVGGMYGRAIEKIVYWLEKASSVAENPQQKKVIDLLVEYYKTGDLKKFDEYNIAWVQDTESRIDFVNGFIEVYNDALGYRGAFESVVSIKDLEATKRIATVGNAAQWFEDNSPLIEKHKKEKVVGISAKVITVVVESGDASPTTPIGINLPNSNWIRAEHGSKSVNLGNIVHAYNEGGKGSGLTNEFACSDAEVKRHEEHGHLAHTLHVDMHEVIGHASGKLNPGVGTPKETLKSYASALEEGRADLVGLYYIMDPKLVELGLMPSLDVGKAAYDSYIRGGLMVQLARLKMGEDLEESHMRNRQMVAAWALEKGAADKVIEQVKKDGKTCFRINDYDKLRTLFGQLLRETQRIKSEGDYEAGKALIENYGVKVDPELHAEVLRRYEQLKIKPYKGFVNPKLVAVEENGKIVDVKIEYPDNFEEQQMEYAKRYSFLPTYN